MTPTFASLWSGIRFWGATAAVGLAASAAAMSWLGLMAWESFEVVVAACACAVALPVWMRMASQAWFGRTDAASDQLVGLATAGAFLSGEYATAMLVPLIVEAGHALEEMGSSAGRRARLELAKLDLENVAVLTDRGERVIATNSVRVGDCLVIRPGETVPVDGSVSHGVSTVDESALTGESLPRDVDLGDTVRAGSINLTGLIHVEAEAVGAESARGRIEALLDAAADSKPRALARFEKYAAWFLPGVATLAVLTLAWTRQVDRAVAMLVACCPCGLVLAGPAASLAALMAASRGGIVIARSRYLDPLATADTVIFDKTGTLTTGVLKVESVEPVPGIALSELWRWAGLAAHGSRHPAAVAVARHASSLGHGRHETAPLATSFEVAGGGVRCSEGDHTCHLGKPSWLASEGIDVPVIPPHRGSMVGVAVDGEWIGGLWLRDTIRPEAADVVRALRDAGVQRVIVASGDRTEAVEAATADLRCDQVWSEQLPGDKLAVVAAEQRTARAVLFVGDGINDAPALACADVGIALRRPNAPARVSAADLTIPADDLRGVVRAVYLARQTRRIVLENVLAAAATIVFGVAAAMTGGITPVVAAVAHHAGSALVLANSSRLFVMTSRAPSTLQENAPRQWSRWRRWLMFVTSKGA